MQRLAEYLKVICLTILFTVCGVVLLQNQRIPLLITPAENLFKNVAEQEPLELAMTAQEDDVKAEMFSNVGPCKDPSTFFAMVSVGETVIGGCWQSIPPKRMIAIKLFDGRVLFISMEIVKIDPAYAKKNNIEIPKPKWNGTPHHGDIEA